MPRGLAPARYGVAKAPSVVREPLALPTDVGRAGGPRTAREEAKDTMSKNENGKAHAPRRRDPVRRDLLDAADAPRAPEAN